MSLTVVLVCGPSGSGKSTLARLLAEEVLSRPPHYIRLRPAESDRSPPLHLSDGDTRTAFASVQTVAYTPQRVFEVVPQALRRVRKEARFATVVIEGDSDPCLRHAFPYDYRLFVMPAPGEVYEVFRRPEEAAAALHEVMQDTAEFASEIFGLFDDETWDDDEGVRHEPRSRVRDGVEERLEVSESQVRQFLATPLGAEIASRIQLRPEYHTLVDSDLVLVNMGVGAGTPVVDDCVRRIGTLIARVRGPSRRGNVLYCCDPLNEADPLRARLAERLKAIVEDHGASE